MQLCCYCLLKKVTLILGTNPLLNVYLELEALIMIYGILTQFQLQSLAWRAFAFPLRDYLDFKNKECDKQLNSAKVLRRLSLGKINEIWWCERVE